ncbi:hypothetical protein L1887_55814 [Cichorium endivia]|nr:hypothetical protein L1887_55814 [Cichorium endivia]
MHLARECARFMPDWSSAQGCVLFGPRAASSEREKREKGKREKGKKGKKREKGGGAWSSPNDVRASERCSAWKAAWGRDDEIGRWKKGADRGRHRWMEADRDRQRNAGSEFDAASASLGPNCASGSWSVAMADLDRPAKSCYFSTKQDTDDGSARRRLRK